MRFVKQIAFKQKLNFAISFLARKAFGAIQYMQCVDCFYDKKKVILQKVSLKNKGIFDLSFETLARVANLWYNKMGSSQKELEEKIKQVFGDE